MKVNIPLLLYRPCDSSASLERTLRTSYINNLGDWCVVLNLEQGMAAVLTLRMKSPWTPWSCTGRRIVLVLLDISGGLRTPPRWPEL